MMRNAGEISRPVVVVGVLYIPDGELRKSRVIGGRWMYLRKRI